MKKYLVISLMLAVMLATVPAFAGSIGFGTFTVKATSQVAVSSTSIGNSGSGAMAGNTSFAGVSFGSKDVTTLATTIGTTGGYGWNIATQSGSAFATGFKTGLGW